MKKIGLITKKTICFVFLVFLRFLPWFFIKDLPVLTRWTGRKLWQTYCWIKKRKIGIFLDVLTIPPRGLIRFVKKSKKRAIAFGSLAILLVYVVGTGLVILPPQSVRAVRQPQYLGRLIILDRSVPVFNAADYPIVVMTWPRIPWTNIGQKEETYPLEEHLEIRSEIKVAPLEKLTGNPLDKGKFAYLVISGDAQIIDWEKFLLGIDPKTSEDLEIQGLTRFELLGRIIGQVVFYGNVRQWYSEYTARTLLANELSQRHGLKSAEEIEHFLKVYRTYYWTLGVMMFKQFEEELTRNPFPDPALQQIVGPLVLAKRLEQAIETVIWQQELLFRKRQVFIENLRPDLIARASEIIREFDAHLEAQGVALIRLARPEVMLSHFLVQQMIKGVKYSQEELYVAQTLIVFEVEIARLILLRNIFERRVAQLSQDFQKLWLWHSKGNAILWAAAIEHTEVVTGKRFFLPGINDFYAWLKEGGMIYLQEKAQFLASRIEDVYGVRISSITFSIEEKVSIEEKKE